MIPHTVRTVTGRHGIKLSCGSLSAGLPYNSIEVLILGNITNNGTTPINLNGGWIIIPFSMGVQTEYEGIWKRISDPNRYFKIFCWCVLGFHSNLANAWSVWHIFLGCLLQCLCISAVRSG